MLDIKLFRENLGLIVESEKKRFKSPVAAKKVLEYDVKWRKLLKRGEELKHKRNQVNRKIAELKKDDRGIKSFIKQMKAVNTEIKKNDSLINNYLKKRDELRYRIGNIIDKSVPIGSNEEDNKILRFWGEAKVYKNDFEDFRKELGRINRCLIDYKPKSHVDLLIEKDLADIERAAKISGSRFFFLKNELVLLNLALQRFALDFLIKKGFVPFYTPFIINHKAMKGASELADFKNMLYKIDGEDSYLIATAEQSLSSYHMDEVIHEEELPRLYAGVSTNFRREAGSHGIDTKGIFRVHQFEKVEEYVFCKPEDSWKWMEKLINITEEIYKLLELPYRVVSICSGELNDNAAKKYDIEVWMPVQGKFRELVSCSNTTDYQSRKLNIRFIRKDGSKEFVHTLNSTAVATQRTIVAILENHQQKDGTIKIPKVLWKYSGFKEIK